MATTKAQLARELAKHHLRIEDGIDRVFIMRSGLDSEDPRETIKLLEVNIHTVPTGSVDPTLFSPTMEVPCGTEIAEVTPEEFQRVQARELPLPPGWSLDDAELITRAA